MKISFSIKILLLLSFGLVVLSGSYILLPDEELPTVTHPSKSISGRKLILGTPLDDLNREVNGTTRKKDPGARQVFAVFTVTNCEVAKAGYPVKGIEVSDADEADIYPTQTVQVNVTERGTYTITTNTVNGITFSASGQFSQTGLQEIVLKAAGTPINYGSFSYSMGDCSFERYSYIPDRRYKDITLQGENINEAGGITARHHRFLYRVFESGDTDEEWLQTNLGTNYNKVGHPDFNPDAAPSSVTDINAFGSLYQWGRYSDGHELMNWQSEGGTGNVAVNDTTSVKSTGTTVGHNDMIVGLAPRGDWKETPDSTLWQGEAGTNNPCPCGFRIPLQSEFTVEANANNFQSINDVFGSSFQMVAPSARNSATGVVESQPGFQSVYWTSSIESNVSKDFHFQDRVYEHSTIRTFAFSVRCIMMSYKFEVCDEGYDSQEVFDLNTIAARIIQDYPGRSVSFYDTFENAQARTGNALITGNYTARAADNPNIIFARLEDAQGNFANGIKIKLYVYNTPQLTNIPTLSYCSTIGSNIGMFDLTEVQEHVVNNAGDITFTYYTTLDAATNGGAANRITSPATYSGRAGSVYVRVQNAHGCFVVKEIPLIITTMSLQEQHIQATAFCNGEDINLASYISQFTAEPDRYKVYFYSNKADADANNTTVAIQEPQEYSPADSGTHTIWLNFSLNSGFNCSQVVSSLTFTVNPVPSLSFDNLAYSVCFGESAVLTAASDAATVHWYEDEAGATPFYTGSVFTTPALAQTTTYWAEAVNVQGCASERMPVQVTVGMVPELIVTDPAEICSGSSAALEAQSSAGTVINWYDSETGQTIIFSGHSFVTPSLTQDTVYWVEAVSQSGCKSERITVTVPVKVVEAPYFNDIQQVYCINSFAMQLPLTSDNGHRGSWSPATINTSVTGIHTYTFTSDSDECENGLQATIDIEVTEAFVPVFNLGSEYFFGEQPVLPSVSENGIKGSWEHSVSGDIKYYTFSPDEDQCATGIFMLKVIGYPLVFTPNGDGYNDYWSLYAINNYANINIKQVYIFDRYGKLITSLLPNGRWDGTFKGSNMPASDYWFKVEFTQLLPDGTVQEKIFTNNFTLLR